jgi:hypothetical protein
MNEKETTTKTRAQFLRDAFEGIKGRQPMSDDELNQWLATDEGKAATIFLGRPGAILMTPYYEFVTLGRWRDLASPRF